MKKAISTMSAISVWFSYANFLALIAFFLLEFISRGIGAVWLIGALIGRYVTVSGLLALFFLIFEIVKWRLPGYGWRPNKRVIQSHAAYFAVYAFLAVYAFIIFNGALESAKGVI